MSIELHELFPQIERGLIAIIEELGLRAPDGDYANTALIDLGLDSLTVAHLREIIAEDFGCEIPIALLGIQLDTVRSCARYITEHVARLDITVQHSGVAL
jgi:acyl carrier protein